MVARPRGHRRRLPTFQMGAGSLTKAEQFVVVDDNTVRVDFLRKDRLTIDLAVIVPAIYNSELVKKHVSEKIPGVSNIPSRTPPAAAPIGS
jgi:hypothetical protein